MILPEWSKYVAAILGAVLLAVACGWFGREIYPPQFLARSAYRVAGVDDSVVDLVALRRNWPQALESPADRVRLLDYMRDMRQQLTSNPAGEAGAPATPAVDEIPDFATAIPLASVSDGQQVTQRCQHFHDWEKGGPNKIGPNPSCI